MSKFVELDGAIVARITKGACAFSDILCDAVIKPLAEAAATPDDNGYRFTFRVIDRRLQALRKAGVLKYNRPAGWTVNGAGENL